MKKYGEDFIYQNTNNKKSIDTLVKKVIKVCEEESISNISKNTGKLILDLENKENEKKWI